MLDELAALTADLEDEVVDLEADTLARIDAAVERTRDELETILTRAWRRVVGDLAAPITAAQADELAPIVRSRSRPVIDRLRGELVEILEAAQTAAAATGQDHAVRLLTAAGVELPKGDE